jgi:hypothetical protein
MQTAVLFVVTALLISQEEADPKDEAKKLMNRGNQAFALEDYESALLDFQKAYDTYPSPKILLNLAETHRALENWTQAVLHYERYLVDASQEDEMVGQVETRVSELNDKVGRLEFSVGEGVEILIDDDEITGTKTVVTPGQHLVTVKSEGHHDFIRMVSVAAGETATVDVQLEPLPAPAVAANDQVTNVQTEPEENEESLTEKWWFWTVTGVVAIAVAGAVVGIALNTGGDDFVPSGELPRGSSAQWERF